MRRGAALALLLAAIAAPAFGARCTTVLDPRVLEHYAAYLRKAEQAMGGRFDAGELAWLPAASLAEGRATLAAGKIVRSNISDALLNQRLAAINGTVIHWIGGVLIRDRSLRDLQRVLEDYGRWGEFYRPVVVSSRAQPDQVLTLGLHSTFRFASILPQQYAFRVQGRIEGPSVASAPEPVLRMHLSATEIRESDSGVPGRDDLLEPGHDHGILWALNSYWRARRQGSGVYLEFESITLARSVQMFACKIGFIPVPRSAISSAMDSIPAESVKAILEGTRAECQAKAVF